MKNTTQQLESIISNKTEQEKVNVNIQSTIDKVSVPRKNYVRPIIEAVHSHTSMAIMLENVVNIDYVDLYIQDEESRIHFHSLKEKLKSAMSSFDKTDLKKELATFTPTAPEKYIILTEELMRVSSEMNLGVGIDSENAYPYLYNGCYWEVVDENLLKEFTAVLATQNGFTYHKIRVRKTMSELYNQFAAIASLLPPKEDKNIVKINLHNGTFVIGADAYELRPFDRADFFKYQLPFDYDELATCPQFQQFLDEVLPDNDSQLIIFEYLGYIFTTGLKLEKCLVLKGMGANGKSVIFDIVENLLGSENVCSYTLSNLCSDSGYHRAELTNYLLNYSSELGGKNANPDTVKKLISNEPIDARSPYGKPFILRNYGKFIFNANKLPTDLEHTNAYFRRFIIIDFDVTIPEEKQNKDLAANIIKTELSGIFNLVLEGLKRIQKNKKFTFSQKVYDSVANFKQESDSVAMFIMEKDYSPSTTTEKMKLKDFRSLYTEYCKENDYMPVGPKEFSSRIENLGFKIQRKGTTNNNYMVYCTNGTEEDRKSVV